MEKKTKNEIKLGIFVSISVLVFIVGIYFVGKRQQLFNSTFKVSGTFRDINGLQVGDNIRFSGINVGIVEEIEQITDTTVRVDMVVVEHARKFMKKNAKAIIGSDGLMGNKMVSILPGSYGQAVLKDNDSIQTTQPLNLDDILLSVKTTADNAATITEHLAVITQNIREGKGTIGKLIMDSVLAENVSQALVNIKQGAGGFKQNMDAASHNILLRGYLRKKNNQKEKAAEKAKDEKEKEKKKK